MEYVLHKIETGPYQMTHTGGQKIRFSAETETTSRQKGSLGDTEIATRTTPRKIPFSIVASASRPKSHVRSKPPNPCPSLIWEKPLLLLPAKTRVTKVKISSQ